ncbi:MAG: glutamine amidotransferase, partial [Candidatus Levybacteria bacterium]|nr:glutamine amidotransferase [Candidatus Levybacteria bacterium]
GSYMHGPILPKNPHFADHLLTLALRKKYGKEICLADLDDSLEWQAHKAMIKRLL